MKKLIKIIIALGIIYLIYQFFVNILIKTHNVDYSILTDNNSYNINEFYNSNGYYFKVEDKQKNKYVLSYNKDYNKQDKIIRDIKYYKTDDLVCILPIYKNNISGSLSCIYNNEQVSYSYLKQIKNISINNIIKEVKKLKYKNNDMNTSDTKKNTDNIFIYSDNIDDNYIFTLWFYKGMYIIENKNIEKKQLLDSDSYENNYSLLVGKYYITFNTDKKANYKLYELYAYNIQDSGKKTIELEDTISLNSYINGVYNNKMYFTDSDSMIQYEVDPYKGTVKKLDKFKSYKNNKFSNIKDDNNKINNYFDYSVNNKEIIKKYGDVIIMKSRDNYYFKTNNGSVYSIINNNYDNPILLFKVDNLKEFKVKDDIVSFISDNTIYTYSDSKGLRPIIEDNELRYNYKNIYDFMKK